MEAVEELGKKWKGRDLYQHVRKDSHMSVCKVEATSTIIWKFFSIAPKGYFCDFMRCWLFEKLCNAFSAPPPPFFF